MIKRLMFLWVIMSAVGIPYLISSSGNLWNSVTSRFTSSDEKPESPGPAVFDGHASTHEARTGSAVQASKPLPPEGYGARDLGEVLTFDGTPEWVMARWPRVTAGLAELDLQGYRVPLVTGTSEDDLAGSLTYYFDKDRRVAFINFHGTTGDPRKLVALVTSRYSLTQQTSSDPATSLYQVKWNGKPLSQLSIRPARIVRADQPRARFDVELALKRP